MTSSEIVELQQIGITDEDDLRYAEFVDFPVIIPIIKRRKLNTISKFLANDGSLNVTITAAEIQQSVKEPTYCMDEKFDHILRTIASPPPF